MSISTNYLILVNKKHAIDIEYYKTLKLVSFLGLENETHLLESVTYKSFVKLSEALKNKGIIIGVDSAFRSIQEQQEIWDSFIKEYGKEYTEEYVAAPYTSEHHTGLALDIVLKRGNCWIRKNECLLKETEMFSIIHKLMPEYGFILRYMRGKKKITGYAYEPWHLRYVGKEHSLEISQKHIALEEYLWKQAK